LCAARPWQLRQRRWRYACAWRLRDEFGFTRADRRISEATARCDHARADFLRLAMTVMLEATAVLDPTWLSDVRLEAGSVSHHISVVT
jgi:hypothetical protein